LQVLVCYAHAYRLHAGLLNSGGRRGKGNWSILLGPYALPRGS